MFTDIFQGQQSCENQPLQPDLLPNKYSMVAIVRRTLLLSPRVLLLLIHTAFKINENITI